jgi:hypothetical protein
MYEYETIKVLWRREHKKKSGKPDSSLYAEKIYEKSA